MWESPIYKLKAKIGGKEKEVFIDVTGSAPNFKVPGKQLESAFDVLLKGLDPSKTRILDFGAAKLRNTLYLLEKGFTVYSCEFDDLFKRSQQAKDFYDECCSKYKNFKKLVFPNDFIEFEEKFDVILLINVLNVMPVPYERLCVLTLCRKRIKENGRLLWYTQHGGYSEDKAAGTLFDGLVTGKGRSYHMFYRDFSREEIHRMLQSTGFSFNKDFAFPKTGNNQSYVFNPSGDNLIDATLGLTAMLRKNDESKLKEIDREVRWGVKGDDVKSQAVSYKMKIPKRQIKIKEVNILEEYINNLKKIKAGGGKLAGKYHQLIFNILSEVLKPNLKNPKKEEKINGGRKRIDVTFDNKAKDGFFAELRDRYKIPCAIISIECKNYNKALETPEYDQISGRLNIRRGMFGIIVCRKVEDNVKAKEYCRDLVRENPNAEQYVIILTDEEIEKMLKLKIDEKEDEINEILQTKYRELIM